MVALAVIFGAGCAQSVHPRATVGSRGAAPDTSVDLPEPRVVHDLGAMATLNPFSLGVPSRRVCPRSARDTHRSVSSYTTVDPFCLARPKVRCTRSSHPAALDEDGIIDPFCRSDGNGG